MRVWRGAGARLWDNLPRLIVVNVLWLAASWPLLTLGAATLTAYAWLRRAVLEVEDERSEGGPAALAVSEEPYTSLPRFFRRLWWPGTLWAGLNALLLLVLSANFVLWRADPGTLRGALWGALGSYLAWFWLALQPFVLDALAEGVRLPRALAEAVRIVLAYPLYAHLCALPPLLLAALGWWFTSLWPLVGVSVLLLYWAQVATGDPAPRRPGHLEDVL
ncbi:hypothetical protein DEIPH_ctg011orf0226 [Deinococcus phoenicis]|uniref:Uncharacterized protein n=1 Tax=Deinococcus phoenicis TaxID=1476583 RepID=A0A016QTA6_9DEIO|nr:hypothetical protein DEIPH_ctg011orf0226 [Deinococcus phoenicis]